MAIRFSAKKGGKNGYVHSGTMLVSGIHIESDKNENRIIFSLLDRHVECIKEYAKTHDKINYYDLVMELSDYCNINLLDFIKSGEVKA